MKKQNAPTVETVREETVTLASVKELNPWAIGMDWLEKDTYGMSDEDLVIVLRRYTPFGTYTLGVRPFPRKFTFTSEDGTGTYEVVRYTMSNLRDDDSQHVIGRMIEGPVAKFGLLYQFDASLVRWC